MHVQDPRSYPLQEEWCNAMCGAAGPGWGGGQRGARVLRRAGLQGRCHRVPTEGLGGGQRALGSAFRLWHIFISSKQVPLPRLGSLPEFCFTVAGLNRGRGHLLKKNKPHSKGHRGRAFASEVEVGTAEQALAPCFTISWRPPNKLDHSRVSFCWR